MFKTILNALIFIAGFCLLLLTYVEQKELDRRSISKDRYKLVEGTFSTTSKANTVLPIKTMFKINIETGETEYMLEGTWYLAR